MKWEVIADGLRVQCMELPLQSYCYICSTEITEKDEILVAFAPNGKPLFGSHSSCFEKITHVCKMAVEKLSQERVKTDGE